MRNLRRMPAGMGSRDILQIPSSPLRKSTRRIIISGTLSGPSAKQGDNQQNNAHETSSAHRTSLHRRILGDTLTKSGGGGGRGRRLGVIGLLFGLGGCRCRGGGRRGRMHFALRGGRRWCTRWCRRAVVWR